MNNTDEKLTKLYHLLQDIKSVVVAFSGGVDSTFLLAAAKKMLNDNVVAITACSDSTSADEQSDALYLAKTLGVRHMLVAATEMDSQEFIANTSQRCYFCKKERFTALAKWATEHDFNWVVEGTHADDSNDFRPGMRAIAEIATIKSPLVAVGFTKDEIRRISKQWGLPTWDKPSAACLVSRLAYGLPITSERLKQVDKAEQLVRSFCSGQVRVRHHGDLARLEVAAQDIPILVKPDISLQISQGLKELGFTFVTLDLEGYRTGSMNEALDEVQKDGY